MQHKARDDWLCPHIVVITRLLTQAGFSLYTAFTRAAMDLKPSGGLSMQLGAGRFPRPLPFILSLATGSVARNEGT